MSTWDEGVPDDIPHENLYGISWNPMNTIAALQRIDGAAAARRVGTDALSPVFAQLLPTAFPNAELVDGELAMRAARRIKTAEELGIPIPYPTIKPLFVALFLTLMFGSLLLIHKDHLHLAVTGIICFATLMTFFLYG